MGELRREFLNKTISEFEELKKEFSDNSISDDFLRRFFRALHTTKGTSNTFNLLVLAKLAHNIENLVQGLQSRAIQLTDRNKTIFEDCFTHLLQTTRNYLNHLEPTENKAFIDKINLLLPDRTKSDDLFIFEIPSRILAKLSLTEKDALNLALQTGKNFYLLRVSFNLFNFSEDFKNFKDTLNQNGEVIAVASSPNRNPAQEINFQIYFTSDLRRTKIENLLDGYSAQIDFRTLSPLRDLPDNLSEVLENLVNYGKQTAQFLNKKIEFEAAFSQFSISTRHLILLNQIASHLLHNAIDHAVESTEKRSIFGKDPTAKIKINLENRENEILFEIEDDGSGIDVEKILSIAREKGLIGNQNSSDEKEALEIIFSQGFSTSESISEISGRGVGLDAVKDLVEKSGGRIEVKTKFGWGSTFSVYLPQN